MSKYNPKLNTHIYGVQVGLNFITIYSIIKNKNGRNMYCLSPTKDNDIKVCSIYHALYV